MFSWSRLDFRTPRSPLTLALSPRRGNTIPRLVFSLNGCLQPRLPPVRTGLVLAFVRRFDIEAATTATTSMKMRLILLAGVVCLAISARGQFGASGGMGGGAGHGMSISGSTAKLFGDNSAFSATIEIRAESGGGQGAVTVPGKIAFSEGKSRFEMDATEAKGEAIPAAAAAQMKSMGMDKMVMISRPDKKVNYIIYPGVQAYVEMAIQDPEVDKPASEFKMEATEIGKETLGGHDCVKNKVVVTDKDGGKHQSTVWNATDLNKFPVKIEQSEGGTSSTMTFKDVKLSKPDAKQFDPPADCKKYTDMMAMLQEVMTKKSGGPPK